MELALYCISRAVESWGQCLQEWGCVSPSFLPPRLDVVMFSLAVASITHCYADSQGQHRDVFRSKYLNVLDFIFGNSGEPPCVSPSHAASQVSFETLSMSALEAFQK